MSEPSFSEVPTASEPTPPDVYSEGPAPEDAPPAPRRSIAQRIRAFPGWLFPKDSGEPQTRPGFATVSAHERLYLLLAIGIATAFALLWEWSTLSAPVPPGDDPSTWILTSYPYVGLPYPSQLQLLGYPPASFPFIGISVLIGGGPLNGGRIYTIGTILALGLSGYLFGRTILNRPALALLGEGLLLGEPDFQQIFYFGGYPNLFALIFLLLSVSFFVMFLRSRRPTDVVLFWSTTAVCILAHSLTAVILLGTLALIALGLLLVRRLPRTVLLSRGGLAGLLVFVLSVGGYYGLTHFLGISHPAYFGTTGSLSGFPTVLLPFHLSTLGKAITGTPLTLTNDQTAHVLIGASVAILAMVLSIRLVRRRWLTIAWIVVAGGVLAVFAEALAGYYLNISTDYRRFEYFLYAPLIGAVLLAIEGLGDALRARWAARTARQALAFGGPRRPTELRRPEAFRRRATETALVLVTVAIVLGAGYYYTVPAENNYETYFTIYAHDAGFVGLVSSIIGSGVSGNLITTSPYSGHWPSTLSTRVTYVPSPIGSVSSQFSPLQVENSELAEITLGDRYLTTNSLVGAGIPGIAASDFNSTPDIGAFVNAYYQQVIRLPPSGISVGLVNNQTNLTSTFSPFPAGAGAPAVVPIAGGYGFELNATTQGVLFQETVNVVPGSSTVSVAFSVRGNGSLQPTYIQARVATIPLIPTVLQSSIPTGVFYWNTTTKAGALGVVGQVAAPGDIVKATPYNVTTGATATVVLRSNASNPLVGSPTLGLGLNLTVSGAYNVLTSLGPWVQTDQIWSGWNIRFAMEYNGSTALALVTPQYLTAEYGAAEFAHAGQWTVAVLPEWAPVTPTNGTVPLSTAG